MANDLTPAQEQMLKAYGPFTFTMGLRHSPDREALVLDGYLRWTGELYGEQHYALTELGEPYRNNGLGATHVHVEGQDDGY